MQTNKSYDALVERFLDGIEKTKNINYGDKKSVRRNNAGVDRYRKAAKQIAELHPTRINDFALFLDSDDMEIRKVCAICMIEMMPCSDDQLSRAYSVIYEVYKSTDVVEKMMIETWLERQKNKPNQT